jgi:hypothetical protein
MNFLCFHIFLYEVLNHWSNIYFFSIFTNQYAGTKTKSHHYYCPAARALSHHLFTHKGCVIIAREPRWHLGVILRTFQTTLVACNDCEKVYIRITKRNLEMREKEHFRNIKLQYMENSKVGQHTIGYQNTK